jgi:hypothetical protein
MKKEGIGGAYSTYGDSLGSRGIGPIWEDNIKWVLDK